MATLVERVTALAGAVRDKINLMVPRLLPSGGATGAVLTKSSATDYAAGWVAPGKPRLQSVTSSATVTATSDTADQVVITAQAAALTLAAPTGTPSDGQKLVYRIKDNGTARGITWNSAFRAIGVTLPTTTVVSKTLYVGVVWNAADSKWDVIAVATEA